MTQMIEKQFPVYVQIVSHTPALQRFSPTFATNLKRSSAIVDSVALYQYTHTRLPEIPPCMWEDQVMERHANVLDPPGRYAAYLVRLWQDGEQAPWRASAQSVHTGEKMMFASLEALFTFLEGHTLAEPTRDLAEHLDKNRELSAE